MKKRELQGIADGLCQMAVSTRLEPDLEMLADLPDGELEIDLLKGSASHRTAGPLPLQIGHELANWLQTQTAGDAVQVSAAAMEISFGTDTIPTDHRRIVMFSLQAKSEIHAAASSWFGKPQTNRLWHRRPVA